MKLSPALVLQGILFLALLTVSPVVGHSASTAEKMVNDVGKATQNAVNKVGAATENAVDYVDDAIITTQIKSHFLGEKGLASMDISVETNDGIVTLSGQVEHEAQISLAGKIAENIKGVKKVVNTLSVRK